MNAPFRMNGQVTAFLCGVLFSLGLGISGMTQPDKIIGFLDVTGPWDPALLWVMLGAIAVTAPGYRCVFRRVRPVFEPIFHLPGPKGLDGQLFAGSALFGVGWGLGGFCPGPALTALVSGYPAVAVFVIAMLLGMRLFQWLDTRGGQTKRETGPAAVADA
jgi:uncharacterized membrane protein YedE/YeeE